MKKILAAAAACTLTLTSLASCDFDDVQAIDSLLNGGGTYSSCALGNTATDLVDAMTGMDCNAITNEYKDVITRQGTLLNMEEVKQRMAVNAKDYSMAMVLNATAINKLFRAATTWNGAELPTIQVGGCRTNTEYDYSTVGIGSATSDLTADNCLTFDFGVTVSNMGLRLKLGVPITAVVKGDDASNEADYKKGLRTAIFADLPKAQIVDVRLNNKSVSPVILLGIESALKMALKGYLKRVSLFDISAWEMGNNNIKMIAGGPVTNETEGTLTLGMYSNIDLGLVDSSIGENARVTWEEDFPKDAEVGLHIHPDLIRGIIDLMFAENFIEDDVSIEGASIGASQFKVTMADMALYPMQTLISNCDNWHDYFTLGVRLWSMQSMCGYIDLLAGMNVQISNRKFELGFGNVQPGMAKGVGSLAKIILNQITGSQTFQDMLKQTTLSFNFDQFKVPAAPDSEEYTQKAATDAVSFLLNNNGLSLYLNFMDL